VQATLVEEPFTPVARSPTRLLEGVGLGDAPPLMGYVSTQPRESSEVLLESTNGAPVLARWRYGLGTAAVFTSDAKDRWAAEWLGWRGFGPFWARLVRSAVRREPAAATLTVAREGGRLNAVAHLRDARGRPREGLRLRLVARRDDGFERPVPLLQVGLGRYEADVSLPRLAEAGWRFRVSGSGEPAPEAALTPLLEAERRLAPPDAETLARIAASTGGRFGPDAETALLHRGTAGRVPTALLPWLAAGALLAWLLDIGVRRGPWFWRRWAGEAEALGARAAPTGISSR
jgi:hypothetical protein